MTSPPPSPVQALCGQVQDALFKGRPHEALEPARAAVRLQPQDAMLHNNLGVVLHALGEHDEAIDSFNHALRLRPGMLHALVNCAGPLRDRSRLDEAEALLRRALEQYPHSTAAHWNLALLLLRRGRYGQAWPHFESRWAPDGHCAGLRRAEDPPPWPIEMGLPTGRTVRVTQEQGLGDAIQFVRFVPLLAQAGVRVELEAAPPLRRLFEVNFGAVAQVVNPQQGEHIATGSRPNWSVPMMSLAAVCGVRSDADVPNAAPYLTVPSEVRQGWQAVVDYFVARHAVGATGRSARRSRPAVVGLVWSGNPLHAQNARRSIELQELLAAFPEGHVFVSLQKEVGDAHAALLCTRSDVLHVGAQQADLLDAAALCLCCDVVVTVDTSIAHLAGALGCKTFLLLHASADWRWGLEEDRCAWYPTVRLFRQQEWGQWVAALARMAIMVA